jgi:hypothetical protein
MQRGLFGELQHRACGRVNVRRAEISLDGPHQLVVVTLGTEVMRV